MHERRVMVTLRAIFIFSSALIIFPGLLSCSRTVKDPDCVSREALTNLKLIVAAGRGDVKVMNDMIKAGANVNISDDVFGNPIATAASSAHYEAVKLLIYNGADVNVPDHWGMTPLMSAAQGGNPEVVRLLLTKGAEANASNKKRSPKFTALAIAKYKKNEAIIRLLEDAGAKE